MARRGGMQVARFVLELYEGPSVQDVWGPGAYRRFNESACGFGTVCARMQSYAARVSWDLTILEEL